MGGGPPASPETKTTLRGALAANADLGSGGDGGDGSEPNACELARDISIQVSPSATVRIGAKVTIQPTRPPQAVSRGEIIGIVGGNDATALEACAELGYIYAGRLTGGDVLEGVVTARVRGNRGSP